MDKKMIVLFVSCMLLIISCILPFNAGADKCSVTTIDSNGGGVGFYISMALDTNDRPHISYIDVSDDSEHKLKYAIWTGNEWRIELLDSSKEYDSDTSLAIDSNDDPHIAYYDSDSEVLKYAKYNRNKWSIEIIDQVGWDGGYPSIVLDSNDHPHIGYRENENWSIKYAKWTGSEWHYEELDSLGRYISLILDHSDKPHMCYHNDGLIYAKNTSTSWSFETVDTNSNAGWGSTDMAIDSEGNIHIGYTTQEEGEFNYANNIGNNWNTEHLESIDSRCDDITLDLDSEDNPHLVYYKSESWTEGEMIYIKWTGTEWSSEIITECNGGGYPGIVIDGKDDFHICFYDGGSLKYAQKGSAKSGTDNDNEVEPGSSSIFIVFMVILIVIIIVIIIVFLKRKKKSTETISFQQQPTTKSQTSTPTHPQTQPSVVTQKQPKITVSLNQSKPIRPRENKNEK